MITFADVLDRIAEDIAKDTTPTKYDFNMCISDDPTQATHDFICKYGSGKNYDFPVLDYKHGKELAAAIFRHLSDKEVRVPDATDEEDKTDIKLYLCIHLTPVKSS